MFCFVTPPTAALMVLSLSGVVTASQRVLFVSPSGLGLPENGSVVRPPATIQAAIDSSQSGDVVVVRCGTYAGVGNRDLDFGGRAITLTSETGQSDCVTLDCKGSSGAPHRGFIFQHGEGPNSIVRGFKVVDGYAAGEEGGGIRRVDASPLFENVVVTGNQGAGVRVHGDRASPTFRHCSLSGNTGPGMKIDYYRGTLGATFDTCRVSGNTGPGIDNYDSHGGHLQFTGGEISGNGGAGLDLYSEFATVDLDGCVVRENGADGILLGSGELVRLHIDTGLISGNAGAGVHLTNEYSDLAIHDTRITDNASHGVAFQGLSDYRIDGCTVLNNAGYGLCYGWFARARVPDRTFQTTIEQCEVAGNALGGIGGNTWVQGDLSIADCRIHHNLGPGVRLELSQAYVPFGYEISRCAVFRNWGDGLRLSGDASWSHVVDCTVADNAGHSLVSTTPELDVQNTIVAGNELAADVGGVSSLSVACTDIHGNGGGDWTGPLARFLGVNGNFSLGPLFCAPGKNRYDLLDLSPCLPGQHPGGGDCGLIGPCGEGCKAAPFLLSLCDVPDSLAWDESPRFFVFQNHPNPVRDETWFWFDLPAPARASLRIFDASGRVVADLLGGWLPRGRHSVRWNGKDNTGARLASGVYFYRVAAGERSRTRKLLLLDR